MRLGLIIFGIGGLALAFVLPAPVSAQITNPLLVPGLSDSVYHRGTDQSAASPPSATDIANEMNYAATHSPNYTFINTNAGFQYNGGDTTPTNSYLGADAAGAAATDTTPLQTTLFDALGYINITTTGNYNFTMNSADDGGAVLLNGNGTPGSGQVLVERNYTSGLNTSPAVVDFTATGLYPIEIFTYNQTIGGGGGANFNLAITGPASVSFLTSAAPLPASVWGGLALLAGLGLLQFRGKLA